jgi:hypothetical protein
MTPLRRAHLAFIPLALLGWLCAAVGLWALNIDGRPKDLVEEIQ